MKNLLANTETYLTYCAEDVFKDDISHRIETIQFHCDTANWIKNFIDGELDEDERNSLRQECQFHKNEMIFEQGILTDMLYNIYVVRRDEERPRFDALFRQALETGCKVRALVVRHKSRKRAVRHRVAQGLEPYEAQESRVDQTAERRIRPRSEHTTAYVKAGRARDRNNKRKKKPCRDWSSGKRCRFGDDCHFFHASPDGECDTRDQYPKGSKRWRRFCFRARLRISSQQSEVG